jgi:hypothetical protein
MLPDRALHVLIDLLLRHSRRVITGRWYKTGGNLHSPVSVALLGPRTKCEQMNGPGPWSHCINWGQSSSPALYQDRLILACYNPSSSFLLALDKRTGKQIWRTDREKGVISYSTPLIIETPQGPVVALNTSERVEAFDPITGKLKWQFSEANHFPIPCRSSTRASSISTAATAAVRTWRSARAGRATSAKRTRSGVLRTVGRTFRRWFSMKGCYTWLMSLVS